ncbi:DNA-binding NtrC family response regulator [Sphingomonas sp. UYAg733]
MEPLEAILVIDDDHDVLQAAQLALSPHAERIVTADSPDTVAAMLASARFDCVLLDMNFAAGQRGGAEGMTALAAIRAADPTLAVVLMTAYGGVSLAVESLKQGADDFLLKPWRNDALVAAVRGAAQRTRTAREPVTLDTIERAAIARAIERSGGNIARAAGLLGLTRPTLYRRMAKHGL